jgi:radical SAM protein with 4Fe4S-binding SPASM domain
MIPPDAGIALGLGLTNECNLACAFCYRDPTRTDRLSLDQVKAVMDRLPVRSVNLGTGEKPLSDLISAGVAILNSTAFEQARTFPEACNQCEFRATCHGGCAGRRRLQNAGARLLLCDHSR